MSLSSADSEDLFLVPCPEQHTIWGKRIHQVADKLKSNYADECYNPNGIVPRAVSMIKERFPDSIVCTDVALDPYSDQGHDGVVQDGKILNDETIMQLTKQVRREQRFLRSMRTPKRVRYS